MLQISEFLSENFQFLVEKFSVYLNRHVFVMTGLILDFVVTWHICLLSLSTE